jgi:hypothetical protein
MQDYFEEYYEWDGNVPRKKKRVARDRDRISFPMTAMDAAAGRFHAHFSDGSPDHTSPHRPGYRFADTNDPARLAAESAYRERCQDMHYTSRRNHQDGIPDERHAARTLDELRQAADAAYREKCERLRNAWRNR